LAHEDKEAAALFRGVDMKTQGSKMAQMFTTAIDHLEHPLFETLVEMGRKLGHVHRGFGAKRHHFDSVGRALMWTLEQGLGPRFDRDTRAAWTWFYQIMSDVMCSGLESETPRSNNLLYGVATVSLATATTTIANATTTSSKTAPSVKRRPPTKTPMPAPPSPPPPSLWPPATIAVAAASAGAFSDGKSRTASLSARPRSPVPPPRPMTPAPRFASLPSSARARARAASRNVIVQPKKETIQAFGAPARPRGSPDRGAGCPFAGRSGSGAATCPFGGGAPTK
jgi:hemoglobin-like flavoprotein